MLWSQAVRVRDPVPLPDPMLFQPPRALSVTPVPLAADQVDGGRWIRRRGQGGPRFSVVVGRFQDTVVATLHGPLDLAGSVLLARALGELIEGGHCLEVVLDLGDMSGIDGSGVDVVASAARRMKAGGGALRVARPSPAVAESLAAGGDPSLLSGLPETTWCVRAPDRARRASLASHPAGTGRVCGAR